MYITKPVAALAALLALLPAAHAADILVEAGEGASERLVEALISVEKGGTVKIGPGRFELTEGLSLDVDDVKVQGAGAGQTVLSFAGQTGSGEGLLVTSDRVVLEDFAVENTKGDGVKSKGSDTITFRNLSVVWTSGPKETNGAYGVYPVSSKNVLIDGVFVSGASDAGIYVGQSENIIVRNSRAEYNVAGIEIENSRTADVTGNTVTHNTGGILVFDLPNLPVQGGRDIRVFDNDVVENDTANFAPKGNIVASTGDDTFDLRRGTIEGTVTGGSVMMIGISNGEPLRLRVAFKPTATIAQAQATVDLHGQPTVITGRGRHDPCVLPRAVPIVEAMVALVLADHMLQQRCARV